MDERVTAILKKRAQRYAPPLEEKKQDILVGIFVGCRIGEIQFALPSAVVVECAPLAHWTPFFGHKHLLGITHLRGDVMSLIDLSEAVTGKPSGQCNSMAVIQAPHGRFAVPVSEVLGMRNVEKNDLIPQEQWPLTSDLIFGATRDFWFLVKEKALLELA
jgi:Chemotaxis signal transduction protein